MGKMTLSEGMRWTLAWAVVSTAGPTLLFVLMKLQEAAVAWFSRLETTATAIQALALVATGLVAVGLVMMKRSEKLQAWGRWLLVALFLSVAPLLQLHGFILLGFVLLGLGSSFLAREALVGNLPWMASPSWTWTLLRAVCVAALSVAGTALGLWVAWNLVSGGDLAVGGGLVLVISTLIGALLAVRG